MKNYLWILVLFFNGLSAAAQSHFIYSRSLQGPWPISFESEKTTVYPPLQWVEDKIKSKNPLILNPEIRSFTLGHLEEKFTSVLKNLSAAEHAHVMALFRAHLVKSDYAEEERLMQQSKGSSNDKYIYKFNFTEFFWPYVDTDKFAKLYSQVHEKVKILTSTLRRNSALRKDLIQQLKPFISIGRLDQLTREILSKPSLLIDDWFVPEHMKKLIGRFTTKTGLNCYQAALMFHKLDQRFNLKEEKNHHPRMVNYDEMWVTLDESFVPVSLDAPHFGKADPIEYGDLIVFLDGSQNLSNYKSLLHASVYLLGGFSFAKGSKFAESTYGVQKVSDEWNRWYEHYPKLKIKVYRRKLQLP